ncbi:MAG: ABC transporter permease [Candidatus Baldrarchaeia archaeon]
MRKTMLILKREIFSLKRSKILLLLTFIILGFLYGLYLEAENYKDYITGNPGLTLEYQTALFTDAVWIIIFLNIGIGRIMLGIIGATSLAKEFENKTMSTLGCLPIRRESIFLGKFLAIALISLSVALFYSWGTWVICLFTLGPSPLKLVFSTMFFIFIGCLYFALLSIFCSSLFKSNAPAIFLALGLIYLSGFFVYGYPAEVTDWEKWFPEYYLGILYDHLFMPEYVSASEPSFYLSITVILLSVFILLAVSAVIFKFRDI